MKTILTIDDDLAAVLERLRGQRGARLEDLVDEALRCGQRDMAARPKQREPFRTRSMALGRVRIDSIGNTAEALAIAEGKGFR